MNKVTITTCNKKWFVFRQNSWLDQIMLADISVNVVGIKQDLNRRKMFTCCCVHVIKNKNWQFYCDWHKKLLLTSEYSKTFIKSHTYPFNYGASALFKIHAQVLFRSAAMETFYHLFPVFQRKHSFDTVHSKICSDYLKHSWQRIFFVRVYTCTNTEFSFPETTLCILMPIYVKKQKVIRKGNKLI